MSTEDNVTVHCVCVCVCAAEVVAVRVCTMCVLRWWRSECGWVQCHLYLALDGGPALLHKAQQDLLELPQGLEHLNGHTHLGWVLEGAGKQEPCMYVVYHTWYIRR